MVKMVKNKQVKKLLFQFVFSTYLHVVLLKFRSGALFGWGIQLCIQRVPTWHTFARPHSMKNKKCTIKNNFIRTNRIEDDDVNHRG